jgi:hypothetical protein
MGTPKPKMLEDFPKFVVTAEPRPATAENGYRYFEVEGRYDPDLEGPFDQIIKGERPTWFWLLNGERGCLCPELESFDKETRTAILASDVEERGKTRGRIEAGLSQSLLAGLSRLDGA